MIILCESDMIDVYESNDMALKFELQGEEKRWKYVL